MDNSEEHTPLQQQSPSDPPTRTRNLPLSTTTTAQKGCLLQFLTIFSSVIIVCGIGIAFLQIASMYYMAMDMSLVRAGIRLYVIFFSIIVILNELEVSALVRNSIISYSWIARGLLYCFIGLIVLDQHVGHHLDSQVFRLCFGVFGHTLFVAGVCYFLMGLMCLKRTRDERWALHCCVVLFN